MCLSVVRVVGTTAEPVSVLDLSWQSIALFFASGGSFGCAISGLLCGFMSLSAVLFHAACFLALLAAFLWFFAVAAIESKDARPSVIYIRQP